MVNRSAKFLFFEKKHPPPTMISRQGMEQDCAYMYSQINRNQPDSGFVHLFNGVEKASDFGTGRQVKKHQTTGYGHPGKGCESKGLDQARKSDVSRAVRKFEAYQCPQVFEDQP